MPHSGERIYVLKDNLFINSHVVLIRKDNLSVDLHRQFEKNTTNILTHYKRKFNLLSLTMIHYIIDVSLILMISFEAFSF